MFNGKNVARPPLLFLRKLIGGDSIINGVAGEVGTAIKSLSTTILNDKFILLNIYDIRDFSYIFSLKTVEEIEKKFKNKIKNI